MGKHIMTERPKQFPGYCFQPVPVIEISFIFTSMVVKLAFNRRGMTIPKVFDLFFFAKAAKNKMKIKL